MAMNKRIISSHFPYFPLHLKLKLSKNQEIETDIEALIDTGFSGDIALPLDWIKNGHLPDGYATWTMADGSSTMTAIYIGSVRLIDLEKDKPFFIPVIITVLGDEVMAGRGLTDRFKLTLDHGKKLIVES